MDRPGRHFNSLSWDFDRGDGSRGRAVAPGDGDPRPVEPPLAATGTD
jgi:hypothetical protein